MMAGGSGVGGSVLGSRYGSPKLKMSSTQPSGVMSCRSSEGYVPSWIQKHFTVSARSLCGARSSYLTGACGRRGSGAPTRHLRALHLAPAHFRHGGVRLRGPPAHSYNVGILVSDISGPAPNDTASQSRKLTTSFNRGISRSCVSVFLSGSACPSRLRQGPYRVVYEIHDRDRWVTIFRVAHRREVYR